MTRLAIQRECHLHAVIAYACSTRPSRATFFYPHGYVPTFVESDSSLSVDTDVEPSNRCSTGTERVRAPKRDFRSENRETISNASFAQIQSDCDVNRAALAILTRVLVAVVGVFFAGTVVVRAAGHLDEAPGTGLGRRIACGKTGENRADTFSGSKRCAADENGMAARNTNRDWNKEKNAPKPSVVVGGGRVRRRRAA